MLNSVAPYSRLLLSKALILSAALLGLSGALSGCAPRAADPGRAVASTSVSAVSFYPAQTGLAWSYLPEGDSLDAPRFTLAVEGPTLFGDARATAFRFQGRGADRTLYRTVSDSGVLLLGFTLPGGSVTFDPPLREYPAASEWKSGLTWNGETRVKVLSGDGKVQQEGQVSYRYTVLEKRNVTVGGEKRDVWVVNRQITDSVGGLFPGASQEAWFAPNVGELRTPEGLVQVSRNYKGG